MSIHDQFRKLLDIGGLDRGLMDDVSIVGQDPVVWSPFHLGEAAALALAAQAAAINQIWEIRTGRRQKAEIDVVSAAISLKCVAALQWNGTSVPLPDPAYPTIDIYPTKDGRFFMPHGGYPKLRDGILKLLGTPNDAAAIGKAILTWNAQDLENAVAAAGLCGAMVRSRAEWLAHPQGKHLAAQPLVLIEKIGDSKPEPFAGPPSRPLAGVRVLDSTHVLAGPTNARTLAEQGADVLHIAGSQPSVIPSFVMDTGHGKRATFIDLKAPAQGGAANLGNLTLGNLVRGADVFSESYRPGAMADLGFGPADVAKLRPGIIYVSTSCYGEDGPWGGRPGWEQLAQVATGMAVTQGPICPDPRFPTRGVSLSAVYPNDYVSGYLAAYGTLAALIRRAQEGGSYHVRVVLSRTAMWLQELGLVDTPAKDLPVLPGPVYPPFPPDMLNPRLTEANTPYGPLSYLAPVSRFSETPAFWDRPTVPLGHDDARWLPR